MPAFTQVAADAFQKIQINAGVMLTEFDPAVGTLDRSKIIGATSGGVSVNATPSFSDYGEDIDNVPKNTMELKRIDSWEIKASGTYITADTDVAKSLIAAVDEAGGKLTPRNSLRLTDFKDVWWVGDYSDVDGGFIAVELKNVLSTGGLQIQSTDKGKGQFAFEYTCHYSMEDVDDVPFAVYVTPGQSSGNGETPGQSSGNGETPGQSSGNGGA